LNIEGLHLFAQYKIDLDQYKQARFLEKDQNRIIIDQISHRLANDISHKQNFFSEKIIVDEHKYILPYKVIRADCYVLTKDEFFKLVESIKKDIMSYYPIGHIDIVDNKNNA
jgi:hypothetical protein